METRTYYYARVSSKEQNLDRQIEAFAALGADERDIITDKESGKDLNRTGYTAVVIRLLLNPLTDFQETKQTSRMSFNFSKTTAFG